MARALTEGTERYDAVELTEAAERLGASLHAEAGWDATSIGVDVPSTRLEPALELLAEVLLHPTFPAAEVDRLRDERLNDLLQAQADPRRRADETFIGTIYAPTVAVSPPGGGHARDRRASRRVRGHDAPTNAILDPARATLVVGGDLGGQDVAAVSGDCSAAGREPPAQPRPSPVVDEAAGIGTPRPRRPSPGQRPDRDPHRPPRACPAGSRTSTPSR